MLDFRLLRTTSDIIRAYGNMSLIEDKQYYDIIPADILDNMIKNLDDNNYMYIYLYQFRKYNEIEDLIEDTGKYFLFDIRTVFGYYDKYEKIQKMSFLNQYG